METSKTPQGENVETDYLHSSRFCDVIMKGGVTSGVVYPRAITSLARTFIFRNIAGTSVGAIAAALTAAAEYDRRFHNSGSGFAELDALPDFLAKKTKGKTNLIRQFWADSAEGRWQLDSALKLVGNKGFIWRLLRVELQLALWYCWAWIVPTVAMIALADPSSTDSWRPARICLAVILGLVAGACALPVVYVIRVVATLRMNDFGWCHGHDQKNDEHPHRGAKDAMRADWPLSDWLADKIDAVAGLPFRQTPLTFGALQGGDSVSYGPEDDGDVIAVRMMTTCLTLQQPFSLPFDPAIRAVRLNGSASDDSAPHADTAPFWWKEEDLARYFPRYVIDHLKRVSSEHSTYPGYRSFPKAKDLPLVVAARMSLSFPILLCAVPLYAFRQTTGDPHVGRKAGPVRVWFSDGGLTSNLPIHFFDNPIPRWPTFALDLLGMQKGQEPQVFIESTERADSIDPWEVLDKDGRCDILAFLSAILDTTRTWRDRVLARLPGYSDRAVGIRLKPDEGGLNLNMDETRIRNLTTYGERAAGELLKRFAPAGDEDSPFWKGHRWTRYAASMAALARWKVALAKGLAPMRSADWQESYFTMIASAIAPHIPGEPSASPPEATAKPFETRDDACRAVELTRETIAKAQDESRLFAQVPPHPLADFGAKPPY